ncbi:hypothetical protein [Holospora obtusa]|uniref:hypothetical protein n=1 Tax=Holospora obtusa TaxID=49893 RepID=UPI0003FEB82C|nr:hypothetical protein [Holospora obtusa]
MLFALFQATAWGYVDAISDHLLPPLTCKDILFTVMPLDLDKDGDIIRYKCYTLCMHIEILKYRLIRAEHEKEKRLLTESIKSIDKLLKIALIAFRAHFFVFGPLKFREFLCETKLK